MIRLEVARKAYGGVDILRDIVLTVEPGERVALLGPSGIGKSTLLRIAAGIDTAFDGRVNRPGSMAMVFQEPTLLPWRSARANLTLTRKGLSAEDADDMLAAVGLQGKESLFPGQLSLGQQRRLALARAFAIPPDLLILDEPFVSLDKRLAAEMVALTGKLLDDYRPAMLFVTHEAAEAEALGARQIHLGGSPATLTA